MAIQRFHGGIPATTLAGSISSGDTSLTIASGTGWAVTTPIVITLERGTANEERILVGAISGVTLSSLTRGYDGTTAKAHSAGAATVIEHTLDAAFLDKTAHLIDAGSTKGDIAVWTGSAWTIKPAPTNGHALIADSGQATGWSSAAHVPILAATNSIPVSVGGSYAALALPANVGNHGALSSPGGVVSWKGEPLVVDTTANIATARALAGHQYDGQAFADTTKDSLFVQASSILYEVAPWPFATMYRIYKGSGANDGSSILDSLIGVPSAAHPWGFDASDNPKNLPIVSNGTDMVVDINGYTGFWLIQFSAEISSNIDYVFLNIDQADTLAGPYDEMIGGSTRYTVINGWSVLVLVHLTDRYIGIRAQISSSSGTPSMTQGALTMYRLPGI